MDCKPVLFQCVFWGLGSACHAWSLPMEPSLQYLFCTFRKHYASVLVLTEKYLVFPDAAVFSIRF